MGNLSQQAATGFELDAQKDFTAEDEGLETRAEFEADSSPVSKEAESQKIRAQVTEPAAHKPKTATIDSDADIRVGQKVAGNISSSAVSTVATAMVDQADNIYEKVDSIMGKMEANPVAAMRVELLDSYFAKLENITGNVESCLTMFNTWKRRYRKDPNLDLKQEVKESIDEMQTAFHAYREGIADKKKQLQPPPTAPVVGKNIKGEDEFKNIGQQELLKSEKAGVLDGGEFAKFDIQTLTPVPVCKDESSYLPQSAAVQPDLQADISSQTTKTKTLFTTENCRVTMRKPAGYGPQAQVSPHEPAKLQLW